MTADVNHEAELSVAEIRKLNRDLRILIATNGTLTRILNVLANEEIAVQIIKQQIHDVAPKIPELEDLAIGRVLQRDILLKGRTSGNAFVAAESLIAIDLLPRAIMTSLTETDRPIGEVMAASCIETFKEEAKVWAGKLPSWLALDGYQNSRTGTVARRYRIIAGGQPVIIITEYFLRTVFEDASDDEFDQGGQLNMVNGNLNMVNGNLAELLTQRASEAGWYDKPAYYAPDVVTHGQIHDGGARLGEVLRSRGLSSGDRVLLCLPDSPELVQLLLACLARGIMAFLANPDLHRDDHAFQERDTEPALVVTSGPLRDRFQPSGVVEAAELVSDATRVGPGDYKPLSSGDLAYATYTSGTTGLPKAAIHRHADPLTFVEAMCRNALRLTPRDTGLCSARMYFAYGLGNSVWFPLATGGSAVINPVPISPEVAATLSARFEPSVLYAVPNFFARVVDTCAPDSFRSLRCVVSAGEAMEIGLAERVMEFFGGIPILDGIGSTEVGQTFVSNSVDEWRLGTLGKVLPPYEIRVVAPDGTTAVPGVEGDLWVRGSSIAPGYWNWPEPPPGSDGWLDTRDRVSIDDEGWVTYHCRADDTEIVGGVNVNPREIERLIIEDDAVAEAAVVGVRESTGASTLQAFLVPTSDAFIDELVMRDIHRRLLNRLSAFKVPHRFAIVERLPRTANGKLLRSALRMESPTKPIWELPLTEPRSDAPAQRDNRTAESAHPADGNVGEVTLKERLAVLQQERHRLVADAVCTEAAKMLGEPDPRSINRDLAFSELGFDSQMTVELCNRLAALTGLRLPETIGWDYGSISGLAQYLEAALSGSDRRVAPSAPANILFDGLTAVEEELKKVEEMVSAIGSSEKQLVADRLRALLGTITGGEDRLNKRIQAASTPDEIFRLIDSEFGES